MPGLSAEFTVLPTGVNARSKLVEIRCADCHLRATFGRQLSPSGFFGNAISNLFIYPSNCATSHFGVGNALASRECESATGAFPA